MFRYVLDRADLDVVLSYNHYTLQNTMLADLVPYLKAQGGRDHERRAVLGPAADERPAAPLAQGDPARSARSAGRPPSTAQARGVDIAQLALQFSIANEDMATCVVGSANPENVRKWAEWADAPIDETLLAEVLAILRPIHDWFYIEGRPENNDPPSTNRRDLTRPTRGDDRDESPAPGSPQELQADRDRAPGDPGPGEALVRVHRIGICGTDISGYLGKMPFFSYPRIPGHELGVEVVEVGDGRDERQGRRPLLGRALHQRPGQLRQPPRAPQLLREARGPRRPPRRRDAAALRPARAEAPPVDAARRSTSSRWSRPWPSAATP